MRYSKLLPYTLLLWLFATPALSAQQRRIMLAQFAPLEKPDETGNKLAAYLAEHLEKNNFSVSVFTTDNTNNTAINLLLNSAQEQNATFAIAGFYRRNSIGDLVLYAQVYSVTRRALIDAVSFLPLSETLLQASLGAEELRTDDRQAFSALADRLTLALRSNPKEQERPEKLQEHVFAYPAIAGFTYPRATQEQKTATGTDVFRLLAEKEETISIVSKSVSGAESAAKSSAIVTVFSRRQIEATGARNLTDMLKLVPGVEVFYDQMGFYKVSFRGIRSKSGVLLLLDGHRINNFYDGSTFLDLRADIIEKIEIIRGPGSSVHGTNAFVGVINVVTRDAASSQNWWIASRYGAFNTLENSLYYGDRRGDFSYAAHGHFYSSDRQSFHIPYDASCPKTRFIANQCDRTQIPLPLRPDIRTNDRKDQINTLFDLKFRENWYLRTNYIHEDRGPNVGELSQVTPDSLLSMRLGTLDLGFDNLTFGKLAVSSRLYGDYTRRMDNIQVEREDILQHAGLSPRKKNSYNAITFGNETIAEYPALSTLTAQLGVQVENLRVTNYTSEQNYRGTNLDTIFATFADYDNLPKDQNRSRTILGVFTQLNWNIFTWLSLTAGARYDYYSDFGSTLNPKGGLVATVFDSKKWGELIAKALYGQAFRAPTFQELYDRTQRFLVSGVFGNPNLKPERIQTFEAGLEYTTFWRPLKISGNAFYNVIRDNIEGTNVSGTVPTLDDKYRNLRGLNTVGFEAGLRLQLDPKNWAFANFSLARTTDYGGFTPYEDRDVITMRLDVPQMRSNIGVATGVIPYTQLFTSVAYSSFRAANYRYAFEAAADRRFRFAEYFLWNISLASAEELFRNLKVRLTVFNLLDTPVYDELNGSFSGFENRAFPKEGRYVEARVEIAL